MSEANRDENQAAIANQYDRFLYVKELPEPLRSMRMADLRASLERFQRNGYAFAAVVQHRAGHIDVFPIGKKGYIATKDYALREVYDLRKDLLSQLYEPRAMHLEDYAT